MNGLLILLLVLLLLAAAGGGFFLWRREKAKECVPIPSAGITCMTKEEAAAQSRRTQCIVNPSLPGCPQASASAALPGGTALSPP